MLYLNILYINLKGTYFKTRFNLTHGESSCYINTPAKHSVHEELRINL
jgi:hypothetical protein